MTGVQDSALMDTEEDEGEVVVLFRNQSRGGECACAVDGRWVSWQIDRGAAFVGMWQICTADRRGACPRHETGSETKTG